MAVDVFLKIDGIPGESNDSKHKNEIDVLSFQWGVNNPARGPVRTQEFVVVKHIDAATPLLIEACCSGDTVSGAQVIVRKAGDKPLEYIKITMEDVLISSVTPTAGSGDALPMEQVSLNFSKIEFQYQPQKPDGSASGWVTSSCSPRGHRGWEDGKVK